MTVLAEALWLRRPLAQLTQGGAGFSSLCLFCFLACFVALQKICQMKVTLQIISTACMSQLVAERTRKAASCGFGPDVFPDAAAAEGVQAGQAGGRGQQPQAERAGQLLLQGGRERGLAA